MSPGHFFVCHLGANFGGPIMAISKYVPSVNQAIKIAVAMVIIFLALKWLPIPTQIRDLFRV